MKTAYVICILILCMIIFKRSESFASKQEKSQTIFSWFNNDATPTFAEYKQQVPNSDIVEYEYALALQQQNKLTQGTILASLL